MDGMRPSALTGWSNGVNGPAVTQAVTGLGVGVGPTWDQFPAAAGRGRGFAPGRGRGFSKWAQTEEKPVGISKNQEGTNGWQPTRHNGLPGPGVLHTDVNCCFRCKSPGHISRDCPGVTLSRGFTRSPESQVTSTEMWAPVGGPVGDRNTPVNHNPGAQKNRVNSACYKCGGPHHNRDCPTQGNVTTDRRNIIGGRGMPGMPGMAGMVGMEACYNCGETGHFARECRGDKKRSGGCGADGATNGVGGSGGRIEERSDPYIPNESLEENLYEHGVGSGINFRAYENIPVDVTGHNIPDKIDSFGLMGLDANIMSNIMKSKYCEPTPVQKYAIPMILAGRDVMSCAQTGSGKTAAFLIPVIQRLLQTGLAPRNGRSKQACPQVVIMSPTRELAIQIKDEARKFCRGSDLRCFVAYGGTSCAHQSEGLEDGCNILVATPGRLKDFVERGKISYSQVQYLVLDEADRMLDMGFKDDIVKMVRNPDMPGKSSRRTMMFSATFPDEIQKMAFEFLADDYLFLRIGRVGGACKDVEQRFEQVAQYDKREKLLNIIRESRERNNGTTCKTLVFVETKKTADFLASYMCQSDVAATSIHGDRLQREREEALKDFKCGDKPVLVATAVAARGLDIKGVELVVNYDLPKDIDEYVHRIGRTGRVGNTGCATSFYDSKEDGGLATALLDILTEAQQTVPNWLEVEARRNPEGHHGTGGHRGGSRDIRTSGPGLVLAENPTEKDEGWD